jgi:hypothetical protein
VTESAEGARLLSECMSKDVPRVRIPASPPNALLRVEQNDRVRTDDLEVLRVAESESNKTAVTERCPSG